MFDRGIFVKVDIPIHECDRQDLSRLGRSLSDVAIVDNSPCSYVFHPSNAIPIESW